MPRSLFNHGGFFGNPLSQGCKVSRESAPSRPRILSPAGEITGKWGPTYVHAGPPKACVPPECWIREKYPVGRVPLKKWGSLANPRFLKRVEIRPKFFRYGPTGLNGPPCVSPLPKRDNGSTKLGPFCLPSNKPPNTSSRPPSNFG